MTSIETPGLTVKELSAVLRDAREKYYSGCTNYGLTYDGYVARRLVEHLEVARVEQATPEQIERRAVLKRLQRLTGVGVAISENAKYPTETLKALCDVLEGRA